MNFSLQESDSWSVVQQCFFDEVVHQDIFIQVMNLIFNILNWNKECQLSNFSSEIQCY